MKCICSVLYRYKWAFLNIFIKGNSYSVKLFMHNILVIFCERGPFLLFQRVESMRLLKFDKFKNFWWAIQSLLLLANNQLILFSFELCLRFLGFLVLKYEYFIEHLSVNDLITLLFLDYFDTHVDWGWHELKNVEKLSFRVACQKKLQRKMLACLINLICDFIERDVELICSLSQKSVSV